MYNCAVYLRVSTEDQARKSTPIPSQLTEIREWAKENNARILEDWIIADEGISGSTDNRPGFQKLIKAAKDGAPFDTILVFDRDRFFRNFEEQIYYEVVLRKHGVQLISITENEDPPLVKYIKGIVAEETRNQIIKHTIRGMKETTRQGFSGGGRPPYGLRRILLNNGKVTWGPGAPDEVKIVKKIFQWYLEGIGYHGIVNRLNRMRIPSPSVSREHCGAVSHNPAWSKSVIYHMLRNRALVGDRVWNKTSRKNKGRANPKEEWIIEENAFEGIIDRDTFKRVEVLLDKRCKLYKKGKLGGRKITGDYLLSGIIYCMKCGHHYTGYRNRISWSHRYYECGGYRSKGSIFCERFLIDATWLETRVFDEVSKRLCSPQLVDQIVDALNQNIRMERKRFSAKFDNIQEIKNEISQIDFSLSKFIELIKGSNNVPKSILNEMVNLEYRKAELSDELKKLQVLQQEINDYTPKDILPMLSNIEELLEEANSPEEKRKFVESFIPRIDIYPREKAVVQMTLPPIKSLCANVPAGRGI